jgi:uncharacterized protein involved in exopolysaccharide biosynthesis
MVRLVLLRLLESYFRHRWLYLLPFVLMSALGAFYVTQLPPVYIVRGTLYVQQQTLLNSLTSLQNNGYSWRTPAQATVSELGELMQTEAFVRAVIAKTPLEAGMSGGPKQVQRTIDRYRESVWLAALGDNLVGFYAKDEDPQLTQQLVAATMDMYLQWKVNGDRQESLVAQEFFAQLIPPYQEELKRARDALTAYVQAHPAPVRGERPVEEQLQVDQLQSALDVAQQRLLNAVSKDEEARLALAKTESDARNAFVMIDAPVVPAEADVSLRRLAFSLAIFLAAGAILSLAGVVGGALLDRTFRFPIDVRHALGLPVLATIGEVLPGAPPEMIGEAQQPSAEPPDLAADERLGLGEVT